VQTLQEEGEYMSTEQLTTPKFVDVKTAADQTGMSVAWWRAKIWRRQVPFYRIGRRILISMNDIDKLMAKGRMEPKEHQS
jgi:excisionase family DNA binding protein